MKQTVIKVLRIFIKPQFQDSMIFNTNVFLFPVISVMEIQNGSIKLYISAV